MDEQMKSPIEGEQVDGGADIEADQPPVTGAINGSITRPDFGTMLAAIAAALTERTEAIVRESIAKAATDEASQHEAFRLKRHAGRRVGHVLIEMAQAGLRNGRPGKGVQVGTTPVLPTLTQLLGSRLN
jgi:hypothetical protein